MVAIVLIFALRAAKSKYDNSGTDTKETPDVPSANTSPSASGSTKKPVKNNNPSNLSTNCSKTTVLKKGMKNFCVKSAQELVNRNNTKVGISRIGVDGIFGSDTEKAMEAILGKKTGTYQEMVTKLKNWDSWW